MNIATMTREQRSILLYAETCIVDGSGLLEGIRMNEADHQALTKLKDEGFLDYGRVPGSLLGELKGKTHWINFYESGWQAAHQLRRSRSLKPSASRQQVDAVLQEREGAKHNG